MRTDASLLLAVPPPLYVQSDDPQDYLLFRRDPPGCDANIDCMYFVGLRANRANDTYLDVYLSGVADGWVAIGFSETANMVSQWRPLSDRGFCRGWSSDSFL